MGYFADIYVIKQSRSKKMGIDFLNHFLPLREERAEEYFIPQYADNPTQQFSNAGDLMTYLETHPEYSNRIYWTNKNKINPNKHGMIFYTKDGNMIFGISREAAMDGSLNTDNEVEGLRKMKAYFKTELGYIHYEHPPVDTYDKFVEVVNSLKD